jgi:hypothetical protein
MSMRRGGRRSEDKQARAVWTQERAQRAGGMGQRASMKRGRTSALGKWRTRRRDTDATD